MSKEYKMLKKLGVTAFIVVILVGLLCFMIGLFSASSRMTILGYVEYDGISVYVAVPTSETSLTQLKTLGHALKNKSINVKLGYKHWLVKRFSNSLIIPGDKYIITILENDEAEIERY